MASDKVPKETSLYACVAGFPPDSITKLAKLLRQTESVSSVSERSAAPHGKRFPKGPVHDAFFLHKELIISVVSSVGGYVGGILTDVIKKRIEDWLTKQDEEYTEVTIYGPDYKPLSVVKRPHGKIEK